MSDPATLEFPRGTLPPADGVLGSAPREVRVPWRRLAGTNLRIVVFARRLETGRYLAFARDVASMFAEGRTAKAALRELRGVARQVLALHRERGIPIQFDEVERQDDDELIGSFVIDV